MTKEQVKKALEKNTEKKPLEFYSKQFEEVLVVLSTHEKYNFYAHVLFNMNPLLTYGISTAGVYYKNDKFHVEVNPVFMFEVLKTQEDRLALFIHEIMHVLYMHVARLESRNHKLWNIAGDLCINQFLFKRLNADSVLKSIGLDLGKDYDFPENLTAEQYYELLVQKQEEQKKNKKDKQHADSQDDNSEDDDEIENILEDIMQSDSLSEIEKEIMRDQLKDIIKKAKDKSIGDLPNEIQELINIIFVPAVVDWRTELRNVTGNKRINRESTIKRRNRRFQDREDLKGKLKRSGFNVATIVDASGSMSNEEIVKGLSEIKEICDWTQSSMTLVQVDTTATDPEEFSSYTPVFERKKQGGTHLEPAIDKLDEFEIEYDTIIVITDGGTNQERRFSTLNVPVFVLCTQNECGMYIGENMKKFLLK